MVGPTYQEVLASASRDTAVVTGAANGIGRATATMLAHRGVRVACMDVDGDAVCHLAAQLGSDSIGIGVDVRSEQDLSDGMARIADQCGAINCLATCAGVFDSTPFLELDAATFRRTHEVNVIGTFLSIREAARYMPAGGRICTVASISGLRGGALAGTAAYASTKGGVLALTKSAARSLAVRGITVNAVSPGTTATAMNELVIQDKDRKAEIESGTLLNRIADPDEIASAILFLLSEEASYITGTNLVVDGGVLMY